jgi:homoserine O-acetyltransferase/O-succinyltransferase
VIGTLRRLRETGDRILAIEGSLSGTAGYVCSELAKGVPLSLAVRWAIGLGYAEEDPREDLLGADSARKALILARELGLPLSLADVSVEPFVPPDWIPAGRTDALLAGLRLHDDEMAARVERLRNKGRTLRYLAHVEPGGSPAIRVGLEAVEAGHAAARLVGVEAFVAFTTARHSERPLLVQGTGVGGASAAGAVLAEVFRIAGNGAR